MDRRQTIGSLVPLMPVWGLEIVGMDVCREQVLRLQTEPCMLEATLMGSMHAFSFAQPEIAVQHIMMEVLILDFVPDLRIQVLM